MEKNGRQALFVSAGRLILLLGSYQLRARVVITSFMIRR